MTGRSIGEVSVCTRICWL